MVFSLIAHTVGAQGGSTTTPAINTTGADFIIVATSTFGVTASLTDSKGNTWAQLTNKSGTTAAGRLFYCVSPTVGSGHTFSDAAGFPTICVQAWSGVDTAAAFDVENGATGSSVTSIQTGSVTPANANSLVVTGLALADSTTGPAVINGGFTVSDQSLGNTGVTESGAMAYLVQTSIAAANPTWSGFSTDGPAAVIAVFKAAAGGGGVTGDAAWTEAQDVLTASGSVNIAGTGAWTEAQDALAASGTVGNVSGAAAWTEANDTLAAAGTLGVFGSAAWTEAQDSLAAVGSLGVFSSAAWTEIQDSLAAVGTLSLPTVTGDAAWTEVQDSLSAIAIYGAIDAGDPGIRKRRKAEEERRRKLFEEERATRERRRAQVIDAFERVIEGKPDIPEYVADEIVAAVEAAQPEGAPFDFAELLSSANRVQALWDEYLERDDEEVLILL